MGFGGLQSGSDTLLPETHCPGLVSGPAACTGQDSVGSVQMLSEWSMSQAGWLTKDGRNQIFKAERDPYERKPANGSQTRVLQTEPSGAIHLLWFWRDC